MIEAIIIVVSNLPQLLIESLAASSSAILQDGLVQIDVVVEDEYDRARFK